MKSHFQVIKTKPIPKGRPRMTRRGRVFTPARTLESEEVIRQAYTGDRYETPVMLMCNFGKENIELGIVPLNPLEYTSKLRGDLDNYVKLLMDGLNGIAWADDKQVMIIVAGKSD